MRRPVHRPSPQLCCVVGGLEWPWVRDSLALGDRDLCVSRVVDYSSLVVRGRIPLYWGI